MSPLECFVVDVSLKFLNMPVKGFEFSPNNNYQYMLVTTWSVVDAPGVFKNHICI